MKKIVGFVCAAALVAMMSMTVCAAPSVEAGKVPETGAGSTTSPSTGEPITLMVAGAAVVIGATGVAVTTKKRA